jgi:hypothetical protein
MLVLSILLVGALFRALSEGEKKATEAPTVEFLKPSKTSFNPSKGEDKSDSKLPETFRVKFSPKLMSLDSEAPKG